MRNRQQYVTITHYKEREFYFLNHAIQTEDGFIAKEMEQFHESEKDRFIERIRALQIKYPQNQIVSVSMAANQVVSDKEDPSRASAKIFNENYVIQDKMDIGNIPVTLYFSPFTILYETYKQDLGNKLTLIIGLFDRKLYIMFATNDKIHESWTIGTRGLSEKQVADRVYKSMKAYYKISYKFADNIKMLITEDSPKLLKVLREELSLNILPTQNSIHNLLHFMGGEHSRTLGSYIKSYMATSPIQTERNGENLSPLLSSVKNSNGEKENNLDDIRLGNSEITGSIDSSFLGKVKALFSKNSTNGESTVGLLSFAPLLLVLTIGAYFSVQNTKILKDISLKESQFIAQSSNDLLAMTSKEVFASMGKNAELKKAIISNEKIELKGVVWGIEPLRNSLNQLHEGGEFIIKPLENFMTEFSFKSKI